MLQTHQFLHLILASLLPQLQFLSLPSTLFSLRHISLVAILRQLFHQSLTRFLILSQLLLLHPLHRPPQFLQLQPRLLQTTPRWFNRSRSQNILVQKSEALLVLFGSQRKFQRKVCFHFYFCAYVLPNPFITGTSSSPGSSRRGSQTRGMANDDDYDEDEDEDEESDDGKRYCICNGRDDHRLMVECEGGCENWYHCSCIGVVEKDADDLIDSYICPVCTTETRFTTWKPMCRYFNVGLFRKDRHPCRKGARVSDNPPSKYCCDEHRDAFWKWVGENKLRKDREPSLGGALNRGEAFAIMHQAKTAEKLHALGQRPTLARNPDGTGKPSLLPL
jgi:hypothetical protein